MPIFDQGYQHWSGKLSSHAWRWLVITRRGVRTALQGRLVRLALFIAWIPAMVLAIVISLWGLVERQSALVETIKPLLTSLLGRPILAGPRDYRIDIWTLCFHYFLVDRIVVFDGARAVGGTKFDQPGLALQRPAPLFLAAAPAIGLLPREIGRSLRHCWPR